jgi:periplasmic protein TonB
MGYQALLFCPDEKTARTVTQVLGELEFTIESCSEPFAAVKKLMGQHFDAVVVDCDNEQNATLLFKSARNSTSNQGSLAVAVVEGQAGVAKAFRIGANLVLTKPINIEQAKGTLRVARGLLRKGDPSKPAAATAASSAASAPLTPAASAAKPVAAKPVPPVKPAAAPLPAAVSSPRPAAAAQAKPVPSAAWPATAAASPAASSTRATQVPEALIQEAHFQEAKNQIAREQSAQDDDVLEIMDDSMASPPAAGKTASAASLPPAFGSGSGAASAPAPAREAQNLHAGDAPSHSAHAGADVQVDKPAEATPSASSYAGPEPSFTFGGSNVPEQSSGGSKKILLGVAAAAIVLAVVYFGWSQFGHSSGPASNPTPVTSAPVVPAQTAKPGRPQPATPAPSAAKPTASVVSPSALPNAVPAAKPPAADTDSASDDAASPSSPSSSAAGKTGAAAKPAAEPFVVKGGTARATSAAAAAPDAPAPSMTGIATSGENAPPPDLIGNTASVMKPTLQTMNISQGVSQGLLIKKVQPLYPRNALSLRIEGAVELMATISKTGDITHIKILSGDSQLTRAAAEAVKQWKYKPYLLNGEPVEIQTQVTIKFKLPN